MTVNTFSAVRFLCLIFASHFLSVGFQCCCPVLNLFMITIELLMEMLCKQVSTMSTLSDALSSKVLQSGLDR